MQSPCATHTTHGGYVARARIGTRHRAELRLNAHSVEALQLDWNTQGADAFAFEVLDTMTPSKQPDYDPTSDLQTLELLWLEKLSPFEPAGYNRRPKRADG